MLGRARCDVDRDEADRRHVVVEHPHLLGCQRTKVDIALARDTQDVVIDVGDVAHAAHRDTGVTEAPVEHVEHVIDECMTEVRRVVRRDAADVDADAPAPRLEGHHLLAGGVEQLHAARFYGALDGTPCGRSGSRMLRAASRTAMLFLKLSRGFAASNLNHAGLRDLGRVGVKLGARGRFDDEVMDSLEDQCAVIGTAVDVFGNRQRRAQRERRGRNARLLGDLAHGGRLRRLARLDQPFGKPQCCPSLTRHTS